jgi:hypothetical protein
MKKRLLNEETTRRFMKLARLQPLREGYFEEEEVNENEVQEGMGMYEEDPEVDMDATDMDSEMGDAEPEMDAEAGGCSDDVVSLVSAVAAAIEQHTGCSMTVADDGPGEEPMPSDDMPEEEPVLEQDLNENLENALKQANIELVDSNQEEWLMNETLRRVAARLVQASKNNS